TISQPRTLDLKTLLAQKSTRPWHCVLARILPYFFNCQMDGYQDTLYVHTYRQFYRDCVISGTIDFIFGDSAAVFQDCTLVVRKPLSNQNWHSDSSSRKDLRQPTGLVLQNCSFVADPEYYPVRKTNKSLLGKAMERILENRHHGIFPGRLDPTGGMAALERNLRPPNPVLHRVQQPRPAASKANRVKWDGVKEVPANRIQRFTADEFIDGKRWVPVSDVPYAGGFIFPVPAEDPNSIYSEVGPEEDKDLNGSFKNKSEFVGRKIPPTNAPTASPGSISAAPEYSHIPASPESHIAASPDSYTAAAPALSPAVSQQPGSFFGLNKFLGGW
ncbi:probable pectinesterase/pectinesterase inhibitor 21, partial [Phtheirospermum japonicum]